MEYEAIIGLEVHAQLKTKSKIFCSCPTTFGAPPNQNTCPVCLGLPGVLPVLNREAVHFAIKAGLALGCDIQQKSIWARKNYFYPDLPKGYQISQYEEPLCKGGALTFLLDGQTKMVHLTRIHMEEDAGKLIHDFGDPNSSHVDLNRAGVPLIEIVSEPDMRSAKEAAGYMRALRSILRYMDVCDGNMEEGSLRCDANVSIRPQGETKLGTKVEIKNINSFKFVEKAIEYEMDRQKKCLETKEKIVQETRLWDSAKGSTFSMRSKEDAHDYRYFPDPDLVPLIVDQDWIERARFELPELPLARAERFISQYQIPSYDAYLLTNEKALADYYEQAVAGYNQPKKISNWIMTELLAKLRASSLDILASPVTPKNLGSLIELIDQGTISGKMAKDVFEEMFQTKEGPDSIVKKKNLIQVSDPKALEKMIDDILSQNQKQLGEYRAGKTKLFGFFVGEAMKATKGHGNPQLVNEILKKKLV